MDAYFVLLLWNRPRRAPWPAFSAKWKLRAHEEREDEGAGLRDAKQNRALETFPGNLRSVSISACQGLPYVQANHATEYVWKFVSV